MMCPPLPKDVPPCLSSKPWESQRGINSPGDTVCVTSSHAHPAREALVRPFIRQEVTHTASPRAEPGAWGPAPGPLPCATLGPGRT